MPANSHITLNNNGTASGFVLTKTGGGRIDPSEGVVTLVGNGRISDSLLFSEVECVGPGKRYIYDIYIYISLWIITIIIIIIIISL